MQQTKSSPKKALPKIRDTSFLKHKKVNNCYFLKAFLTLQSPILNSKVTALEWFKSYLLRHI